MIFFNSAPLCVQALTPFHRHIQTEQNVFVSASPNCRDATKRAKEDGVELRNAKNKASLGCGM
jgi:hypothetical protein